MQRPVVLLLLAGAAFGCGGESSAPTPPDEPRVVARRTLIAAQGGRVAWHHGLNLIAFDHPNPLVPGRTEVSVIRPDGTGRTCLTCAMTELPDGQRGQPSWHPSGDFLVIQAPNANVAESGVALSSPYHGPGWGINNDLWLIAADGSWAEKITDTPPHGAALHPHFADTGDRLFWSVREATGIDLGFATPGGENPWDGWHLAIAAFTRDGDGAAGSTSLGTPLELFEGEGSFFESHHLSHEKIWLSRTTGGRPYVDEGFVANADGTGLTNLTTSASSWDEHVAPSPLGRLITFNSSRGFPFDGMSGDAFPDLQMELWALPATDGVPDAGAAPVQLSFVEHIVPAGQQGVTSDYDWGPGGREIAVYYVHKESTGAITRQVIDILTLNADW